MLLDARAATGCGAATTASRRRAPTPGPSQPGEVVAFPVVWGGLTSEPGLHRCPDHPGPGNYVLRGAAGHQGRARRRLTLT